MARLAGAEPEDRVGGGDGRVREAPAHAARAQSVAPRPEGASSYSPDILFHIPAYWIFIASAMGLGLAPALAFTGALPGLRVTTPAIAAILLATMAPVFVRLERQRARGLFQRMVIMLFAVAQPMLLYGLAAAEWARERGDPFWIGAVGMVALTGAFSSLLLARRPPAMLAALSAVWLPLIAAGTRLDAWLIFGCGAIGGGLLVWRQMRIYGDAMAKRHQQQRVQERAFDILVDYEKTGQGWFWETDADGLVTYLSSSLSDAFGCPVEELHGRPFAELFGLEVTEQESAAAGLNVHFAARTGFRDVLVSAAADGQERWWSISGAPLEDRFGVYFGFRGFGWDQTEKRRSQERSSRLAHYDSLTGAANRLQMSQSLETILNAPHEESRRCAVLLIDLDRFKQVNDTLGHPAGDAVLKEAADRLRLLIDGRGRLGRLGGDEFQIILPGHWARDELADLSQRIVANLAQPYILDREHALIGASVGIALAPEDGVTSEALIRNADLALYAAKDAGRGCYFFYEPDLHSDAEERRQLVQDLRDTVATGGLELWYQPVIHTLTETITGFEALLRWTHPRLGRLSPAKFVPIAEEAGLIAPIGEWALRTACKDLASWPESIRVSVNLSPLQFANPALPAIVTHALASAQVAPSRLELEVTEGVFLNEDSSTDAMFTALKRIGVRLALDDFGTGYSSLGYLEAAPFDRIKIDQSFIRGAVAPGSRNGAILASIVGLAEALGMETTAEGIETAEELELARMLGCSHIQGYIYEAPMSLDETAVRLAGGMTAKAIGPRASRPTRSDAAGKVVVEIDGERVDGHVRNVAMSGAMIELRCSITPGTQIALHIAGEESICATVRWSEEGRIGVQFAEPVTIEKPRRILGSTLAAVRVGEGEQVRRTG
ncbi:EAL domain-containing protein [Novosphingobium sp. G106]|uniref:EAL domain-containing protein n=1 Tax=Novosphingobium sp. G106 TaxID=2849500 RepID=UPI001C2D9D99|nr:EAL domain-containing protein [Novosphingobium sp. G106]MBV1686555.1 EAL domain-containing protein [Novosphingobium sp. G106]